MKKIGMVLLTVIILAGCNVSFSIGNDSKDEPKKKEDVKLQLLNVDEEAGIKIEDDDFYSGIAEVLAEDPKLGTDNDFSVHTVDVYNFEEGSALVLVAINRLDVPIKDVSFDFTFGDKNNDPLWEKEPITLTEAEAGVIQPNSAVPVLMGLSETSLEQLIKIDQADIFMKLDNFKYEKAD